jgi:hypothetical protein
MGTVFVVLCFSFESVVSPVFGLVSCSLLVFFPGSKVLFLLLFFRFALFDSEGNVLPCRAVKRHRRKIAWKKNAQKTTHPSLHSKIHKISLSLGSCLSPEISQYFALS